MKSITAQTILITGATDGIGLLAAKELAKQGAKLLLHGRNQVKLDRVVKELQDSGKNPSVEGFIADFSALSEVRKLAGEILQKHERLDILINNAGVGTSDVRYGKDGTELRFAVNYLAPFLLTRLLLPALHSAAPSRIVNVSSAGQSPINFNDIMGEHDFDGVQAYCQSKLALIMFTIDLAEELKSGHITVNSLHPGSYLDTNMVRNAGIKPWGRPETGADAELFLALSPKLENVTGKYFDGRKESSPLREAFDAKARKKLKELSLQLTGLAE